MFGFTDDELLLAFPPILDESEVGLFESTAVALIGLGVAGILF